MSIDFHCPSCSKKLSVKDALAGKKGRCPECNATVEIPGSAPGTRTAVRPKFSSIPPKTAMPKTSSPAYAHATFAPRDEPCVYEYMCHQIADRIAVKEGTSHHHLASNYLEWNVNKAASEGWEFSRVDTIGIQENPGCLSVLFGARPVTYYYYVVTFRRLRETR